MQNFSKHEATLVRRNPHFETLSPSYLFPKVSRYKEALLKKRPEAKIINLSIGNTTEPIPPYILEGLKAEVSQLGSLEGYRGYGPEQGYLELREKISETLYQSRVSPDEIFISDGAKCDIARLQMLFGQQVSTAVQDPTYPVYADTSHIMGQKELILLPCREENDFFPSLEKRADLIYFCSPNNPTGATASRKQLEALVAHAKKNRSILIFDAAYNFFIQDPSLPRSIYEIDGAQEVAIELGSFSKLIGFTGVRLSWSIVPKTLAFECKTPVHRDWSRLVATCFNGASVISQAGGLKALEKEGLLEMQSLISFYMQNATLLRKQLVANGYSVFGGEHIPYLWVKTRGQNSWQAFEELLEEKEILTTPGSGFGPSGEGFLRFSAFSHREPLLEALNRLSHLSSMI